MSKIDGQLLFNRKQVTILLGSPDANDIETGLCQSSLAFAPGDPTLGTDPAPADPAAGSRVQVIPLAPLSAWANVTHTEPRLDPDTGTVKVKFNLGGNVASVVLNVLFWDPSTAVGPGLAHTYAILD